MSLDPETRDQAYNFFASEAPELLQTIESGILTLREQYSTAKVHEIMRAAHSLKGGAAGVGLDGIQTIAHRLEDIFKALYHAEDKITPEFEQKLLQGYDCLQRPLNQQLQTGSYDPDQALEQAEAILSEIENELGSAMEKGNDYVPGSQDLGVDMASSIFEVDVEQALEHLRAVFAQPEQYEVLGEVRAQAEVFTGLAEIVGLTGFNEIAETALQALEDHPEAALTIGQLMVRDLEAGRDAFLNGDRSRGGEPSAELQAYLATDTSSNDAVSEEATPVDEVLGEAQAPSQNQVDEEELEIDADSDLVDEEQSREHLFGDMALDSLGETESVTEQPESESSSDEIFGEIELESSADSESVSEQYSSDEIFGEIEQESSADNESVSEQSSPDEIFGEAELEPQSSADTESVSSEPQEEESAPASLDEAVEAINENFEDLPQAQELPTPPIPSQPSQQSETSQDSSSAKQVPTPSSKPSIRVDVDRLQAMDNRLGELVIQRNSLAVQNQQLQQSLKELLNRFSRFQGLVGRLQEFSDKEVIRQGSQVPSLLETSPSNGQDSATNGQDSATSELSDQPESVLELDFDTLELDQYGALNATLQELLEETSQLEESVGDVSLFAEQSDQTLQQQRKMLEQLQEELIWARMLPLSNILDRFPRILREFSYEYDKPTHLTLEGTGVRVDKSVLEKLYDPLTHLVRNAFDHGIESQQQREQAGKPEEGEIAIRAYYQGNQTVIEVSDDGGGINLEGIKEKAVSNGFVNQQQVEQFSAERLYNFLFEPGFSTAQQVSDLSGRGVGLDVVRDQIRELKGRISLRSEPGKGTTFVLSLPTTQSMAKLLIVLVDTTVWALPSDNIEQIIVPTENQVKYTGNQRFLQWNNRALPIYSLNDLLEYNCPVPSASPDLQTLGAVERPQQRGRPLLILRRGEQRFPLELDRVVTEQELVIKSLGSAIAPPGYVSGCTILGDGKIVPVLDAFGLLESVQKVSQTSAVNAKTSRSMSSQIPTVLVVDDSATQRQTLTFSLQRAGYQVLQASDGREAISVLQRHPHTGVVICDIEMPNMNGFEFLRYRRQDETLNQIPVVMLTSRSSEKHRKLCEHLGASDYFTKPYLEKDFINTLETLRNQQVVK